MAELSWLQVGLLAPAQSRLVEAAGVPTQVGSAEFDDSGIPFPSMKER